METHATDEKVSVKDAAPVSDAVSDDAHPETLTKEQARRLRLKTDLVVMPLAVITMTLAFLDKVSTRPVALHRERN